MKIIVNILIFFNFIFSEVEFYTNQELNVIDIIYLVNTILGN